MPTDYIVGFEDGVRTALYLVSSRARDLTHAVKMLEFILSKIERREFEDIETFVTATGRRNSPPK